MGRLQKRQPTTPDFIPSMLFLQQDVNLSLHILLCLLKWGFSPDFLNNREENEETLHPVPRMVLWCLKMT